MAFVIGEIFGALLAFFLVAPFVLITYIIFKNFDVDGDGKTDY